MTRPLDYPVMEGKAIVIPKGAMGVKIAYRQSPMKYFNHKTNEWIHMNVYKYQGKTYHAQLDRFNHRLAGPGLIYKMDKHLGEKLARKNKIWISTWAR